jgi:putative flippase GtrA
LKIPLAERMGEWGTPWRDLAAFVFFGAVRTVLGYGIYLLLVLFLAYPTAYTVSYASGIFISYYLNARFVFREKFRLSKALQFPIVYLTQYLIGLGSLYLLIEVAHVSKFFAPIVVVIITVPCTYLLSRYVIKGRSRTSQQS